MSIKSDEFADWLRLELDTRAWNNSELARQAGLGKQTIWNILNGMRNPGIESCIGIARALNIPPEDVMRKAGLLPPLPPAVQGEKTVLQLYRRLRQDAQQFILTTLHALTGRSQPHTIAEDPAPYQANQPQTLDDLASIELSRQLQSMPVGDQQKVFDLMKRLRGGAKARNGDVETN